MEVENIRRDFKILRRNPIYLDNTANSLTPNHISNVLGPVRPVAEIGAIMTERTT